FALNSKNNGRIYLAGIAEDSQTDGTIIPLEVTNIQDFADALVLPIDILQPGGEKFTPVVISRYLDGVLRVPPIGYGLDYCTAKPSIRQQRRRTTGRCGIS
ncbi:unnamed protein product, partial [marine sediment metagenome]